MKPTPAKLNYDDDHASIGQTTRSNRAFWIALAPASYSGAGIVYLASEIIGGIIVHGGAGVTATLPTAALLAARLNKVAGRAQFRQCEFIDLLFALLVNAD